MADISSRVLQVRLLILVFIAFIPALGIFWYTNRELRDLQREAKEQELVRRAEEVATDYHRIIDESQAFLGTISQFETVRSARFPECNEHLANILEHTPKLTTISVIGMDGYLACGALNPETPLYLGDRAYYVRATSRGLFSVGEFTLGRITGLPVVGTAQPLVNTEGTTSVIGASLNLNTLANRSSGGTLPEGYTFTVLDRNRRVMVRLPRTGDFTLADSVGAVAEVTFPEPPEGTAPSVVTGTDLDGVQRLFAVAALQSPGGSMEGYVTIGRTRVTLMEEVDDIVSLQLRFLAVGGIILLSLAWALGHFWLARCPPEEAES